MLPSFYRQLLQTAKQLSSPVFRVSWIVFGLSIVATIVGLRLVTTSIDMIAQEAFNNLNLSFSAELQRSITAYEQVLSGAAALLQTRPAIRREEFRSYLQAVKIEHRYPGLQGVGYAATFEASERSTLEAEVRSEGFKDFSVRPDGDRPVYSAIVFLEPFTWRNQRAFGYDMMSEPVRQAAMIRARDTGLPTASGAVELVQETETDVQVGFLLYLPIYDGTAAPKTEAGRREAIKGFVYSPFRVGNLIAGVLSRIRQEIESQARITISMAPPGTEQAVIYKTLPQSPDAPRNSKFVHERTLDINGTNWTVGMASTRAFEASLSYWPAWSILVGGVVLSTLLAGLVASAALRQHESNISNTRMDLLSRELAHRVKNSLAVVQSIASRSLVDGRPVKESREIFSQRLHALARAHTNLVENSWRGVSMAELAAAELQPFGARASLQGPDIAMNADTAQMFVLVVHELATNAVKHGALSCDAGRVEMRWWIEGEGASRTLHFRWKETGGPPVQVPASNGFGQTLLQQAIVHGAVSRPEISYEEDGVRYEFVVPLATVQAENMSSHC